MQPVFEKNICYPQGGVLLLVNENVMVLGGPMGVIRLTIPKGLEVVIKPLGKIKLLSLSKPLVGTWEALFKNALFGSTVGHTRRIHLVGLGYKATLENGSGTLVLRVGFSHEISLVVPEGVEICLVKPHVISLTGADLSRVSQFASKIRSYKKPEPYKGKGIKYEDEKIRLKEKKK